MSRSTSNLRRIIGSLTRECGSSSFLSGCPVPLPSSSWTDSRSAQIHRIQGFSSSSRDRGSSDVASQPSTSGKEAGSPEVSFSSDHPNAWKPPLSSRRIPARQRIMNLRAKYYKHLFADEGRLLLDLARSEVTRSGKNKGGAAAVMERGPVETATSQYSLQWTEDDMFYEGTPLPPLQRDRTPVEDLVPPEVRPKTHDHLEYMAPNDFQRVLAMLRSGEVPHAQLLGLLGGPGTQLASLLEQAKAQAVAAGPALDFSYLEMAARMGKLPAKVAEGELENGAASPPSSST